MTPQQSSNDQPLKQGIPANCRECWKMLLDIQELLTSVQAEGEERRETIEKISRTLFHDNGKPGLISKVDKLEEKMEDIKKLAWGILLSVLGYVAVQIIQIISTH